MKKSLIALIVSLLFSTGGTTQDTPELQNRYSEGGWSNNSAVTGETAYLTLSTHLVILDISGETIVKAGEFELPGEPSALLAQDGYLFACYAGSDSSLQVLDISDPLEPVSLGRVAGRSGRPLNASLSSGLLLFPTQNRILIFDVSNPADVRVRAEIPLDGVRAAALDGGILVAGTSDSLLVYDCGNWNAVACIHRQPVPRVDCMTLTDGRAYVGTAEYPDIGVKILDMGNPAAPSDLAVVETKVTEGFVTEYMNPMQIRAEGNLLYVSTSGSTSLFLFDLTDVRNPRLSGTFRLEGENWISGRSLDVRHPRAYLCLSGSSVPFCRLDVTNPAAPVPNGVYEAPVSLKHQVLSNDTLYLAGEKRLWMYKIRDPQTVEPIGSSRAWHSLNGMAVSNTRLVAVRADSLFVLDCSDPGDIRALGVYVTSRGEFRKPVAAGNRVHVIAVNEQTSFLETIDIADPQHPARLSEYDLQGEGRDLFIAPSDPGRLYAAYASAGGRQGVAVLDARNPAAITVTSDVQTRAVPVSIAVADTLLLAGSNDMGRTTWYLESFSIADITAPAAVSVREGTGAIYSVRVHEGLVFTGFSGTVNALPGIDAVVQQAFHRTGQFIIKPGRPAPSPAGSGFGQGGVGVFNLWNLGLMAFLMGLNPFDLGFFFFAGMAMLLLMAICGYFDPRELYTSGSLGMVFLVLLLASGGSDVAERSVPAPETCRLEQNYPNPFNPQTTIPYTVAEAAHVRLQVFDAQGRLVRTVLDERMPAGAHQAAFTADGLPSGMYFCRIEIGNRVERMRMVLLK